MKKAVGIYEIIIGALSVISAIGMLAMGSFMVNMMFDMLNSSIPDLELLFEEAGLVGLFGSGMEGLKGLIQTSITIGAVSALIFGAAFIVVGALSLGKMNSKTVGIVAIVLAIICGFDIILLILGIVLLVQTNKAAETAGSSQTGGTVTVNNNIASAELKSDAAVDAEIEAVKKKIELAKLKKEAESLNK